MSILLHSVKVLSPTCSTIHRDKQSSAPLSPRCSILRPKSTSHVPATDLSVQFGFNVSLFMCASMFHVQVGERAIWLMLKNTDALFLPTLFMPTTQTYCFVTFEYVQGAYGLF